MHRHPAFKSGKLNIKAQVTYLSVDYALGNSFTVEMREKINKVKVLEQKGSVLAHALRLVRMLLLSITWSYIRRYKLTGYGTPFEVV